MKSCAFASPVPLAVDGRSSSISLFPLSSSSSSSSSSPAHSFTSNKRLSPSAPSVRRHVIRVTLSPPPDEGASGLGSGTGATILAVPGEGGVLQHATADPLSVFGGVVEEGVGLQSKRRRSNLRPLDPVVLLPGFGSSWREYEGMAARLRAVLPFGTIVVVASVGMSEWVSCLGGRPASRVLAAIDRAVQSALSLSCTSSGQVTLVGHSAGGWIGRVYLGSEPYNGVVWNGRQHVKQLICLGTPHDSGEMATKKNMRFVNRHYPGAFYDDVRYVNFAGDAAKLTPRDIPPWRVWDPLWMPRLSYQLTDPSIDDDALTAGDGIVPLSKTFLEGATNVRLRGVWHSNDGKGPWYGDDKVVDYWSQFVK